MVARNSDCDVGRLGPMSGEYTKPDNDLQTMIGLRMHREAQNPNPNRLVGMSHTHETALVVLTALWREGLI